MNDDTSFLLKMEQLRKRGEISANEYALIKSAWETQEQVQQRLKLIEEVARQSVEQENAQDATDPLLPIPSSSGN